MASGYDVAVIGGGLIGAACADALAGEGLEVCVLEAGPFVREASWAGAGMLHPIHPWSYPAPLHPLLRRAAAEHERCAGDLLERTGRDVELEKSGMLVMDREMGRLAEWCGDAIPHERVQAGRDEPALTCGGDALLLPEACHVRNHLLARALLEGARRRGAGLFAHTPATALRPGAVETPRGTFEAEQTVLCAGAWAGRLLPSLSLEPVRGQILLYEVPEGRRPHRVIVFPDGEYAVPRRDGRVLFGSTLERAGFDARPTREACERLAGRAAALLGLRREWMLAAWAGLRPGTASLLPYIGRDSQRPDLILACGHYRNGILLAPLTGAIVADVAMNRDPGLDVSPFSARH